MTKRHFSDDRWLRSDFLDELESYKVAELVKSPGTFVKITNSWIDGEQNCLDAIAYFIYELDGQFIFCDESELQNFCR